MILDKKFLGILDQETGVLVVFSKEVRDTTYDDVNETVTAMNKASLSVLFQYDCGCVGSCNHRVPTHTPPFFYGREGGRIT